MAGTEADRAVFEKVTAKAAPAPAPEKPRLVPPEVIWNTGAAVKAKKAAAAAEAKVEAPAPEAPQRSADGKFTTPEKEQAAFDDAKYELARNALHRSGWTKKELDAMDPEDLVSRGLKRAKALEKDDEAHRIAKEAREAKAGPKEAGNRAQPAKTEAPKPPDVSSIIEPLSKALTLDEAGAKTLRETMEQFASVVSKSASEPLMAKLSEYEAAQATVAQRTEAELVQSAREEIGVRYPALMDTDTFDEVAETVRVLGSHPKYQQIANLQKRVNACFEDACKLQGLQPTESDSRVRDAAAEKQMRRVSGSTVSDRTRPTPTTQAEMDREHFDQVMAKHYGQ